MARTKDFRLFIAEWYMGKNKGLIDEDKGFVMADDLWDRASKGDEEAKAQLGLLAEMYTKRELA